MLALACVGLAAGCSGSGGGSSALGPGEAAGPDVPAGPDDAPAAADAAPVIRSALPAESAVVAEVGRAVSFEVAASDPEGRPLTVEFLVDGRRVTAGTAFSFTPDGEGSHRVTARVSDGEHTVTREWTVSVSEDARLSPAAAVTVLPDSGTAPLTVAIQAAGTDSDGTVARVQVDADGNGTYEGDGPGPIALSHTFAAAGTFRVVVRVTDDEGLVGLAERRVRVTANLPPSATLEASPAEGPAPLAVRVRGQASDPEGQVSLHELDADGDGGYEISSAAPIDTTLVFTDAGRATTLSLRVTDAGGLTDVTTATVHPRAAVDAGASTVEQLGTGRLLADGRTGRPIRVRVVDAAGRPLAGVPVELESSRNGGPFADPDRLEPANGLTDAAGTFQAQLRTATSSTLGGDAVVRATAGGTPLDRSATVQFVSAVSSTQSAIGCPAGVVHVIGSAEEPREAVVTARVRDAGGMPVGDVWVELRTRDAAVWPVSPATGRTNSAGEFRASVTSARPDDNTTVTVIADGLQTSAVCVVIFRP